MRAPGEFANQFHELHQGPAVLVLPNPWDVLSARLLASLGFSALATTSAGVAWAHGLPDGQSMSTAALLSAIESIAVAAGVPVSADIEAGFGETPAAVAAVVGQVIEAGAVGINLEDGSFEAGDPLRPAAEHAARVRAARERADQLGFRLFINARTDVYLRGVGDPAGRFDNAVERAHAYLAAGADGIFVPGVSDPQLIRRLVTAIPAPLNLILLPDTPSLAELEALGVRRLSTGPRLAQAVLGLLQTAALELREGRGQATIFEHALPFPSLQKMFQVNPPGRP